MSDRNLTSGEITMLSTVYGNSIDYSKITVNTGTILDGNATTIENTISFSNFDSDGQPRNIPSDFSDAKVFVGDQAWLVHEVAHVWQWQVNHVNTVEDAIGISLSNGFDYSAAYDYSISDKFNDMNIEQQAAAITDRFLMEHGFRPQHCTDCSPNLTEAYAAINQLLKPFNDHNTGVGELLLNFLMPLAYGADINPQTNDFYNSAQNWAQPRDPLILDLDGDGLETTGFNAANPIYFDHDLNGIKEGTGWVTSDDGFLVLDRNGNGTIDNGFELFGDHTLLMTGDYAADGFAALAQEDTNHDGKVDANDVRFAELRVWRDLNQNGLSEANELFTLNSLGIASINVASTDHSQMLANGNQIADLGSYTKTDGNTGITGTLADINLVANPFYRQFTTHPDTSAVAHLPDMQGSGQVRDLREAASLFSPLALTLSIFSAQNTHAGQRAQLDTLIDNWAFSSGMMTGVEQANDHGYRIIYLVPGQTASNYDALLTYCEARGLDADDSASFGSFTFSDSTRQQMEQCKALQLAITKLIGTLERFNGETFVNVEANSVRTGAGQVFAVSSSSGSTGSVLAITSKPHVYVTLSTAQIDFLNNSFSALKDSVYGSLIMQTRLKPYLDAISLTITTDGIALDFGGLNALLESHTQVDALNAFADLLDLQKYAGDKLNPNGWDGIHQIVRWVDELSDSVSVNTLLTEFGYHTSTAGNDILIGTSGADNINGQGGNDSFFGGMGNDTLTGHGSFEGGQGNDTLIAIGTDFYYYSGDTYLFNIGDGNDTIIEYGSNYAYYVNYYGSKDVLKFGADITPATVSLVRNGNDMIFKVSDTDQVRVKDWFISTDRYIEEVQFADGSVWTLTSSPS